MKLVSIALLNSRIENAPSPPLGILYVGAILQRAGYMVKAYDLGPNDQPPLAQLRDFAPDLIGFSLMTTQVQRTRELVAKLKPDHPKAVYVAGGIHATAMPEWTLRNLGFDYVVRGEGELTIQELCACLQRGEDCSQIKGLAYLSPAGAFIQPPPRPPIENLDGLPLPNRELLDFKRYIRPPGNIRGVLLKRATAIMCGRGCPFGCTFCSSHEIFGRRVRIRSVDNVIDELTHLIKHYAIDGFWLLDDTLLEIPDWTYNFCEALIKQNFKLTWGCQAHVRRIDDRLLRLMKLAGLVQVEFGVESGSPKILKRLRKGTTPEDIHRAFSIARKVGVRTLANFMIGNPDETVEDLELTFRLAKSIRPDHVVATFTTPLPGSDLFAEARAKQWITEDEDFSEAWIIRQTVEPMVKISLDAETMKHFRSRFDNHFFVRNHAGYLKSPDLIMDVAKSMVKQPLPYLKGLFRALRTRRLSHFLETVWDEYNRV